MNKVVKCPPQGGFNGEREREGGSLIEMGEGLIETGVAYNKLF